VEKDLKKVSKLLEGLTDHDISGYAQRNVKDDVLFEILFIVLGAVISIGLYNVYLNFDTSRPVSLWISIFFPVLPGFIIGLKVNSRSMANYLYSGTLSAALVCLGIGLSVWLFNLAEGEGRVNWAAVFGLYFATPFLLFTAGSLIADYLRSDDDPPGYARAIASQIASLRGYDEDTNNLEELEQRVKAATSIITSLAATVAALFSIIGTLTGTPP
jgi:hypothetical protein